MTTYPLSAGQRALWFLQQLQPANPANNVYQAVIVNDALDADALQHALDQVVSRHEALRTLFVQQEGEPVQRVYAHISIPLCVNDATGWDEDMLQEAILTEALRPYDLQSGPLLRLSVWILGPQRYALLLGMHHIITDLWSLALVTYELGQFYAAARTGASPHVSVLRRTYGDFVAAQEQWLTSPQARDALVFWKRHLAPPHSNLDLPADFSRPPRQSMRAGLVTARLNHTVTAGLRQLARSQHVSLHDVLLAAYQVFLYRYSSQDDIIVGVLKSGRTPAFARVVGYFINPAPVRAHLDPECVFLEFLQQAHETSQKVSRHDRYPFPLLVETLQPERDPARNPIFQALFSWQKTSALLDRRAASAFILHESSGSMDVGGTPLQSVTLDRWVTQFDLSLMVAEGRESLVLSLEYNDDLFLHETVRAMVQAFQTLLDDIIVHPRATISRLSLVDEKMRTQLLAWGNAAAPIPRRVLPTVMERFTAQATATPNAIALSFGDAVMTYAELDARSNQLAHALSAHGIGSEGRVALLFEPSFDMIVAILGVMKAGAAYVPIDPAFPPERIRYVVEDSNSDLIIREKRSEIENQQFRISDLHWDAISQYPDASLDVQVDPQSLAYIIYTSGTTGYPKGVAVSHDNLSQLFAASEEYFDFGPDDVWTLFHSYAFDFSVWEIWGALLYGGRLELIPRWLVRDPAAFYQLLADRNVTVLNQTPSAFRQFMAAERRHEPDSLSLRWVIFGGESLDMSALGAWFQRHDDQHPRLVNMYGITETTVHVTWRLIALADVAQSASLIGRPLPHLQLRLLDTHGQLTPIGAAGEIHVGGAGVARGYYQRPQLTARRFLPNPLDASGARSYRSGDLARWLPNGDLQYLGRSDQQIKRRGYRIELGEIAARLQEHPHVQAAVVRAWGDPNRSEDLRLAAYVVPAHQPAPTAAILHDWLAQRLLPYMLPTGWVFLDALPLTAQGKVDRRALPEPKWGASAHAAETRSPQTPLELEVAQVWRNLLGVETVGLDDDFFRLGGHSLLAIRLLAHIEEHYGIKISVSDFFEAPTLAALIQTLVSAKTSSDNAIIPLADGVSAPLSFAQQRLWFLHQMDSESAVYHIPVAVRLRGPLDAVALNRSLDAIIARHAALRTLFVEEESEPRQYILPSMHLDIPFIDLTHLPPEDRLSRALNKARTEVTQPFDLTRGPLLRARLFRLDEQDHIFFITLHHIIADGWSLNILWQTLQALYSVGGETGAAMLPDLPLQYADYAVWQRTHLTEDVLSPHLEYWRQELGDASPLLSLPSDYPRPPVKSNRGSVYRFHLSDSLVQGIDALAREAGATPFMAFMGAFAALLSRYAGQDDVVLGTAVANRPLPQLQSLIGFFVNTLPIRVKFAQHPDLYHLLSGLKTTLLAAFAHQQVPFDLVVDALQPARSLDHTPLFQAMCSWQENPLTDNVLSQLSVTPLPLDTGTARYDLTLILTPMASGLDGWLEYSTDLWEEASIAAMMNAYEALLQGIVTAPKRPLDQQPLLSPDAARLLTRTWNPAPRPLPPYAVPQLFARQVAAAPDAIAIRDRGRQLNYLQLDRRSNQVAHALLARGIGIETPVGLLFSRSIDMIIAMLGVLKAGGAYVPLDPAIPFERLRYMLEDAGIKMALSEQMPELEFQNLGVEISDLASFISCHNAGENIVGDSAQYPYPAIKPDNLAYIIYTSGTTGRPKGVSVPHRAIVRLVTDTDYLQLQPGRRLGHASNVAFDAATFEIWGPLLNGATIVIIPQTVLLDPHALVEFLISERITDLFLTTALFNLVASQRPDAFTTLQTLLFGGQAVTPKWVRTVWEAGPPQRLLHVYGPTETTTFATWHEVTDAPESVATVPIGLPISNTTCHVVDEAFQPVPPGVVGMLLIGGPGLARGYSHRPGLTAHRFLPDPLDDNPGQRLYLTGDLVRRRNDGAIEFVGRSDRQVKLRGFRIELAGIEEALRGHPAVNDAVARLVHNSETGDASLAVYVVMREEVDDRALRQFLSGFLPDYMIPGAIIPVSAFPLTTNGKVDMTALPLPGDVVHPQPPVALPQTPLELTIADIWSQLLGVSNIGREENFFEIGGHSLLATQVISRLNRALDAKLPLRLIFEAPTIAGLAASIHAQSMISGRALPPIPEASSQARKQLSYAQQRLWFLQQLDQDNSFYNIAVALMLTGPVDVDALETAFNLIVARHDILRTSFPLEGDRPIARVQIDFHLSLPVYEAQSLDEARAFAEILARQPFHLGRAPLLRVQLYRLDENRSVLAIVLHHIIADGWSLGIMVRELAEGYQARLQQRPPQLPELSIQYADYAAWQRDWLASGILEEDLAYWREQLAGLPPALDIPTDYPRPPVQSYQGAHESFLLDAELTAGLRDLAGHHNATLFMTLLTAFQALLSRYSRQSNLAVGAAIANRHHIQTESLIGFFVNTLVMRADFEQNPTFSQALQHTRHVSLDAFLHQDAPFDAVVEALQPPRDMSRTPLIQALFVFQNALQRLPDLSNLDWRPLDLEPGAVKFDITLSLAETEAGLQGVFGYATDLFRPETIRRLIVHYEALLRAVVAHPEHPILQLPLATPDEREQVLAWAQGPQHPLPDLLPQLWAQQVMRTPDAVALAAPFHHLLLTYAQLDARSNQLAHALIARKIGPGSIVAIALARTPDAITALLGVLKAGAAFLPIDPATPAERIHFMLEDAGVDLVIGRLPENRRRKSFDAIDLQSPGFFGGNEELLADFSDANPWLELASADQAYIIYTSGSTGRPKGVVVPHGALANYILAARRAFRLDSGDQVLQFASLAFDAALEEIFATFVAGATLVLRNEEVIGDAPTFLAFCEQQHITLLDVPTSYWHFLAESILTHDLTLPEGLKRIVIGGERARPDLLRRWLTWRPRQPLVINTYGPTETTIVATMWQAEDTFVREQYPAQTPIGRPISNTRSYVLDASLQPAPIGVPGELFIAGAGLADGYLNHPDLTADRFLPDPFSQAPGARMYRTGDLVRWLPDGNLEYLGRLDQQVKISGYRIEPEEVAAVLAEHPDVQEAAVLATSHGDNTILVAYFVPNGRTPDAVELLDFLRLRLPGYMFPAQIIALSHLPRTPGGKINAAALPRSRGPRQGVVLPRTPLEKALAEMWEELLDVRPVGVHDDFFALGGDSLRAAIFINRLQDKLDQAIFVAALFEAPTVAELADLLERDNARSVARWLPQHNLSHLQRVRGDIPAITVSDIQAFGHALSHREYEKASEEAYRAAIFKKNPPAIFVLSAPRSGSTLLRVMLAGHPQLFSPPELYLASFHSMVERAQALAGRQRGWAEGLIRAVMAIFDCSLDEARLILGRYEAADWSVHRFYRRLQSWLHQRTLVDKTTTYALSRQTLERIESIFRDARYVHLIRHPHASVHSYLNSGIDAVYLPETPFVPRQRAELIWLHANSHIRDFLSQIPEERQFLLRFEDLVQQPEAQLIQLCEFLGIEFHPNMLHPYRGERMTDGVHPESRMVGDPNFLRRHAIDAAAAKSWLATPLDAPLHPKTLNLARIWDYAEPAASLRPGITSEFRQTAPLSYAQERLWFLARLQPDHLLYHMAAAVRMLGPLDYQHLQRSLDALAVRHHSLRTLFPDQDGQPYQRILPQLHIELPLQDLSQEPAENRLDKARQLAQQDAAQPFDLASGPLLRVQLYRLAAEDHVIAITMHHIIADGWSVNHFLRELDILYRAGGNLRAAELPGLPVQYADYAVWQREWLTGEALKQQLDYWKQQLVDAPSHLALLTDFPRQAVKGSRAGVVDFHVPQSLSLALQDMAYQRGATTFMALLAVLAALFSRYAEQYDLVIGAAVANRPRPELENLIGLFVNTLAMRLRFDPQQSFSQLIAQAREVALAAFAHQDAPFELVVEAIQPPRDLSRTPVFQIMFAYQNLLDNGATLADLGLQPLAMEPVSAPFDLSLTIKERADGLAGQWLYDADLFRPDTIERLSSHLLTLLQAVVHDPQTPVAFLPLSSPEELAQIHAWNHTAAPISELTIPQLVARWAQRTPDAIAIELEQEQLTYAELDARANQLAHALIARGIGPEDIVALHLPRSTELLAAILGVLKAGAAFLAIDPTLPSGRIQYMLEDAAIRVVVSSQKPAGEGESFEIQDEKFEIIDLQNHVFESGFPITSPPIDLDFQNTAYIIYTSGTTGRPKGVMLQHRGLVNFITSYAEAFDLSPQDRMLQFASFSFDAALCESFMALISGATLVLVPEKVRPNPQALTHFLEEARISVALLTPTILARTRPPSGAYLRAVIAAGEACTWDIVRSWGEKSAFFNGYGPTEATIGCSYHRVVLDDATLARTAPIGRPIHNARLYVLSAYGALQPVGAPGELYIGGYPVGNGYLNRPDLTANAFLPDSFGPEPGARLYRTGDRVRLLADGVLEFLGRVDRQIKLRGVRIEVGEIEQALLTHPSVAQASALLWQQDTSGQWFLDDDSISGPVSDAWLLAYVSLQQPETPETLRSHLIRSLPAYMLPARIHILPTLPTMPTGKVDIRALPAPDALESPAVIDDVTAPDPLEASLIALWQDVLHRSHVVRHDDFFVLGGHSLLAAHLAARISQTMGHEVPLTWVFEHPTPASMARRLRQITPSDDLPPILPFAQGVARQTAPLSFAQQRLWFLEQLEPGLPLYHIPMAIRLRGPLDIVLLTRSLDSIIARHESLRTVFLWKEQGPVQRILPPWHLAIEHIDLTDQPKPERLRRARELAGKASARPFDLSRNPPLRAQLYRLDENDHVIAITMHHIISDGWSAGVMLRELAALYQADADAEAAHLPKLTIQYPDYAVWQRNWLTGQRLSSHLAFWRSYLDGAPPLLPLPTDFPRPEIKSSQGDVVHFIIPQDIRQSLDALAREAGATPFMALLGVYATLLARYANYDDIVIGTAVANRPLAQLESLIGFFVNTLALRLRLRHTPAFRELLPRLRQVVLEAFAHQVTPFELVVDAVQPPRDLSYTPIFQAAFAYNQDVLPSVVLPDVELEPLELETAVAKYDLLLAISEVGGQTQAALQYSTDLWRRATMEALVADFLSLLHAIVHHPDTPLTHLPAGDLAPLTASAASDSAPTPTPPATSRMTPVTPQEALLKELWQQALGREDFGVEDNFFEIGGDSILITHIIAHAHTLGLHLTPRLFFQFPTIAQLASRLPDLPAFSAEQELITGPVPLTPVQHWFFEQNLSDFHHWNQSLLLEIAIEIDSNLLLQALRAVITHHDMLRARFHHTDDGWMQEIVAESNPALEVVDLAQLPTEEQESEAARLAATHQAGLDIRHGPIFKTILFRFGKKRPDRVLLIVHHLVMDSVAWRILLTDIFSVYGKLSRQESVHLPPKTTSYRQWSRYLHDLLHADEMVRERMYWVEMLEKESVSLPSDYPVDEAAPSCLANVRRIESRLHAAETEDLMHAPHRIPNVDPQHVLLMALMQSLQTWLKQDTLILDVEAHGRVDLGLPVNLSRTVGWFTQLYPLRLTLSPHDDLSQTLVAIAQQARTAAEHAYSYGILRYLSHEDADAPLREAIQAPILFNYMGNTATVAREGVRALLSPHLRGPERSVKNHRSHLLEISALVVDGRLQVVWQYDNTHHRRETIQRLADAFMQRLQTILFTLSTNEPDVEDVNLDDLLDELNV